jgi:hypothetical protein
MHFPILSEKRDKLKEFCRIDEMEKKYNGQFQIVFEAIKKPMEPPPEKPKRRIGFRQE